MLYGCKCKHTPTKSEIDKIRPQPEEEREELVQWNIGWSLVLAGWFFLQISKESFALKNIEMPTVVCMMRIVRIHHFNNRLPIKFYVQREIVRTWTAKAGFKMRASWENVVINLMELSSNESWVEYHFLRRNQLNISMNFPLSLLQNTFTLSLLISFKSGNDFESINLDFQWVA